MKLDFRTMLIMLAVFALGYAVCLAMPMAKAQQGDRIEVSEIVADRIIVRESIGFVDGPQLSGSGGLLTLNGGLTTGVHGVLVGYLTASGVAGYVDAKSFKISTITVISNSKVLQNVTIDQGVIGGAGLDVGKLDNHPASDFVLKSEIGPEFCEVFCPLVMKSK